MQSFTVICIKRRLPKWLYNTLAYRLSEPKASIRWQWSRQTMGNDTPIAISHTAFTQAHCLHHLPHGLFPSTYSRSRLSNISRSVTLSDSSSSFGGSSSKSTNYSADVADTGTQHNVVAAPSPQPPQTPSTSPDPHLPSQGWVCRHAMVLHGNLSIARGMKGRHTSNTADQPSQSVSARQCGHQGYPLHYQKEVQEGVSSNGRCQCYNSCHERGYSEWQHQGVLLVDESNAFSSLIYQAAQCNVQHICPSLDSVLIQECIRLYMLVIRHWVQRKAWLREIPWPCRRTHLPPYLCYQNL